MPRVKTSKAIVKPARFNPIHPAEAEALAEIQYWEEQGYNFKQLVLDRILRAKGHTPDMYARNQINAEELAGSVASLVLGGIDNLLHQFGLDLISTLKSAGYKKAGSSNNESDYDDEESVSAAEQALLKNFIGGYKARQQQISGDDE